MRLGCVVSSALVVSSPTRSHHLDCSCSGTLGICCCLTDWNYNFTYHCCSCCCFHFYGSLGIAHRHCCRIAGRAWIPGWLSKTWCCVCPHMTGCACGCAASTRAPMAVSCSSCYLLCRIWKNRNQIGYIKNSNIIVSSACPSSACAPCFSAKIPARASHFYPCPLLSQTLINFITRNQRPRSSPQGCAPSWRHLQLASSSPALAIWATW